MQIAIFLYDHFTGLDAIGPYEVLSRVAGVDLVFVGEHRGPVRSDTGCLTVVADASIDEVPAPDVLVVPGWSGAQQAELLGPGVVRDWLRAVDGHTTWTTAVCTGSVVLASAGLLDGRRATTHWLAKEDLRRLGAQPVDARVVVDGKYVTAAGVSAGLDMALTLAAELGGASSAQAIQLGIEYDPQPPFDAGSARKAPADIVDAMTAMREFILYGAPSGVVTD